MLGQPSAAAWPPLNFLPHWRDNTENVRAQKPEYPAYSRLAEVIAELRSAFKARPASHLAKIHAHMVFAACKFYCSLRVSEEE